MMAPRILAPDRVIPDVWNEPAVGSQWCDCECDHDLTLDVVKDSACDALGEDLPEWISHSQVILVAMEVWSYFEICRFFILAVEEAACRVWGEVCVEYRLDVGLAIVKDFSNHWNGCPAENCDGEWLAEDIEEGCHEQ